LVRKIYAQKKAPTGAEFKIQDTGQGYWALSVKEPSKKRWDRIQVSVDAKFLYQVMMNQRDFKNLKEVVS